MLKKIQPMLILALCGAYPAVSSGATRTAEEAKIVAAEFFQSGENTRLADKNAFTLVHTATDESHAPVCYVLNANDGKGFVIVSADEDAMSVIAFSDVSTWNINSVPDAAGNLLKSPVSVRPGSSMNRVHYAGEMEKKEILTPTWSQEAPFNNNIPNRRLTGCVGLALAEILKYHQYPDSRPASLVNSGEVTTYAWGNMRNDNYRSGYDQAEAEAVATLVADAAIAIGTDFGQSSSSAFEVKVPYALTSMFGYDAGVSYKKRSEISKEAWDAIIANEINDGRPVLYSGQDVSSGHAFVADGYEKRGNDYYFHINWGWGGSANGYYASDALNPVVSKAHHYNDLTTIVYNIKPATNSIEWSPIHVTSDERQVGLTIDVTDISAVNSFTVRAGALKNISNTDFAGKMAVALYDASGHQKCLLSDVRNFNLWGLQITKYVDFSCKLPSGISVADGDVVRLATQASDGASWVPVAGDLLAPGDVLARGAQIPYFNVTVPASTEAVEITAGSDRVIKGRDYSFSVVSKSVDNVVTVKANGFILTGDANHVFRISNVLDDQNIDILVQNAADVLTKSTLWVNAGNLQNLLTEQQTATIKDLTLFGTINVNDFNFMRDRMKLERLDLSQVTIVACGSNPANAIPTKAFMGYRSLKQIILPPNLTTFKNGCLAQTGLTSIEVPASVGTWEYNVFVGCNQLREVTVRRSSPAWINWCVFNGTPQTKLVVPVGATAAYQSKEYWQDFKEIVEENPVAADHFTLTVAEQKGVKFTYLTEGTEFNKGDKYEFKVDTDDSFADAVMQVFANSTRLSADASGIYTATINGNTLIHVDFKQPQATTPDNTWKLTGDAGGIGLVSEVVNVPFGRQFIVRANAIKVPKGDDAAKFYGMVLTDKNGAIKEFISSILSNYYSRTGENLCYNFYCQVKEASITEGNQIRLATSYNKKDWQLVEAEADSLTDRLAAINNPVFYHNIVMPSSVTGARIDGGATQVVRGMPFSFKATAIDPAQRVTVSINGETKATNVAVANISIPAVLEDLDITITVKDAAAGDYMVYNIQEGQLASKLAECPERVKLIGTMLVSDFDALRAHASVIIDLDMADVTIKGAAMTGNSIPENAFAPTSAGVLSALRTVILPNNLERINKNAFARCTQITELTIPAAVNYIGDGAFSACVNMKKIIAKPIVAPTCGNMSPFHQNPYQITLEVPKGSEDSYSVPSTWWAKLNLYKAPANQKDYYWLKVDRSRVSVSAYSGDLNKIAVGTEDVQFYLYLPNYQQPTAKNNGYIYKNVPFRLFDNGVDVFANLNSYQYEYYGYRVYPYQYWGMNGGQLGIRFLKSSTSGPWMPQNHEIEIYFHYDVKFENKVEGQDIQANIIEVPEGSEWRNVPMSYFDQSNKTVMPVLYREKSDIKFQLSDPAPGTELVVTAVTTITKPGMNVSYETKEMVLEGNNGVYTIPSIEGNVVVNISGIKHYEVGDEIPAEALTDIKEEDALAFTELTVTGNLEAEDFDAIRDNFVAVETIDLSGTQNTSLPENAFEGMDQLKDVIISETVTEIGAGCFKDCSSIETLTLPGVTTIGEGAFEGCDNLTSLLIPNLGSGTESGMRRAPGDAGVSAEAFRGLNPNCLIYVGSTNIPDADDLNIILNIDGTRVAASDIVLDGNHSFNAPASFMLGDHRISFTADITASDSCDVDGGWKTLMLPFRPTGMEFGEKIGDRAGSGIHILSFDGEDAEMLTAQTEILPNHPYLANFCAPYASVPVTFYAAGKQQVEGEETVYDVPFTPVPEELVAVGKEFSLYGSYDGQTRPVVCYALNEDASKFVRPSATGDISVNFFSAYLVANEGTTKAEMAIGEHPLWIHEPAAAGLGGTRLYRSDLIEIVSPTKNASIYYTVDGTDPTVDGGTRRLFTEPFAMEGESMNIKAVAERKGNVSDVVDMNFELRKTDINYALAKNWNWISHNAEEAVAVADFVTAETGRILSQTQEVVRDANLGLVGTLTELKPAEAYKVFMNDASASGIKGIAFDPTSTITLHRGWNWIGCPVDEASLLISDLFAGLNAEEGDMIVGLEGFEQADAEGVWSGTLTSLVPGEGYMYYSNSDKEFTYNVAPASSRKPSVAVQNNLTGHWVVDTHRYPSVMPVTATLAAADLEDYAVGAFCGDECRGIGVMVNGVLMINVHGVPGDQISFRYITPADEEIISESSMIFGEKPVGSIADPCRISMNGTSALDALSQGDLKIVAENGTVSLAGDCSKVKSVEVYDMSGARVAYAAGGDIKIRNVAPGFCIIVVRTADSVSYSKILVK